MDLIVKWHLVHLLQELKKLMNEEIIKKDDVVVGILTGRQKDAMLPVDYHNNPQNKFAKPPKN